MARRERVARLRGGERGVAVSSPLALLSAGAVMLAAVAFVATNGATAQNREPSARTTVTASPAPATSSAAPAPSERPVKKKKKRKVKRGETYVEVFNNSGIKGLAGSTAARAQGAGWQVVGADNWYGTIDATTVYYPPRLKAAAQLLGRDLGIERLRPAIDPMRRDGLTVILTVDFV